MKTIQRENPIHSKPVEIAVFDESPRFRLYLPSSILEDENELYNQVLFFGLIIADEEMTIRQRALADLCRFDGSTQNGGVGMGFEVFNVYESGDEKNSPHFQPFLQLLRDIGADEYLQVIESSLNSETIDATEINRAYFDIKPDLVTLATHYVARFPDEWILIAK
jgi:hypothetical protein